MSNSNNLKDNLDVGKMFGNGNGNLDIQQHDLNDEAFKDEINSNMNTILNKFKTINKKPNDTIRKDELLTFLDTCLGKGKQFDRTIADKILNVLDDSKGDAVTV